MFNAIRQTCQAYYDEIPAHTFPMMVKSALYSFTASCVLGFNSSYVRCLAAAGIAALATVVHALTAPIFNNLQLFGNNRHTNYFRELVRYIMVAAIVGCLTSYKVDVAAKYRFICFMSFSYARSLFAFPADDSQHAVYLVF